jgi:outer membrane protein insertion porin family
MSLLAAITFGQNASVISAIDIRGLQNVNRDQIVAAMRTKVGQPYIQSQLDQDRKSIEDLGFFRAVDVRASEQGNGSWQVIVEIVEFPKIKEVRVVGNSVISTEDILKALETSPGIPVAPGSVYNFKSIRPCIDAIRKLYTDRRYFANVNAFGPMEGSPETINVEIIELMVNSVSVQGAKRTKKSVLDKIIRTEPGTAFNVGTWEGDLRRLYSTQWFEKVESIERQSGDDIGKLDLIADVKETQTGMLNVGLQIDPRSSIAGLLSYRDMNFRGGGQSVGINLVQGSRGGLSADLDYGNPFVDDKDTSFNASIFSRIQYRFAGGVFGSGNNNVTDSRFYERRTGASAGISRRIREGLFANIGFKFENIKTTDIDEKTTSGFIQQDGDVATLSVGITRNRRDVDVEPSRGDWLRIAVEPGYSNITKVGGELSGDGIGSSSEDILGKNNFLRLNVDYRVYFSPGQPPRGRELDASRKVIAVRARAGMISGKVPFFEQFFVGGSDSLRGFEEDRFWGRNFGALTLEYRHPIQKSFNAILFADYASAWDGFRGVNDYSQSDSPNFKLGYGIGFSFRTPLGPIRLDFGFTEEGKSRTHFLIGTSF